MPVIVRKQQFISEQSHVLCLYVYPVKYEFVGEWNDGPSVLDSNVKSIWNDVQQTTTASHANTHIPSTCRMNARENPKTAISDEGETEDANDRDTHADREAMDLRTIAWCVRFWLLISALIKKRNSRSRSQLIFSVRVHAETHVHTSASYKWHFSLPFGCTVSLHLSSPQNFMWKFLVCQK